MYSFTHIAASCENGEILKMSINENEQYPDDCNDIISKLYLNADRRRK